MSHMALSDVPGANKGIGGRGAVSIAPNGRRLFLASFLAMIAVGMGFSGRAVVLDQWGAQFSFTKAELGVITGFGLTGCGMTLLLFSVLVERWGYGVMLAMTFAFHMLSGVVTLLAGPAFHAFGRDGAFWCLCAGVTIFAVGNGAAEAAVNPLVAALHPLQRTHRLNMLHAGFPGGLVLGTVIRVFFPNQPWEFTLLMYLVPTALYGALMLGQTFPASQARAYRSGIGSMAREFLSPMLLFLLLLMAMIGFVELGTDSWISNITGNLLADRTKGVYLLMWTSSLMFLLRFVAGPIVRYTTPVGLLLGAACLGTAGLYLLSRAGVGFDLGGAVVAATIAVTVYGVGKTFYWATMLGVTAERFPRGGALVIGAMGCVGNLSAGLLGGPAIGFMQDHFASRDLRQTSYAAFERYRAPEENTFLFFHSRGLDSSKVAILSDGGEQLARDLATLQRSGRRDANVERLNEWWQTSGKPTLDQDRGPVLRATLYGGRMALRRTALVPAAMALGFLLLLLHFRSIGGYRQLHVHGPDDTPGGGAPGEAEPVLVNVSSA
jgi:MFS family permease